MILEYYPYRFVKKDKEPWDGPQVFFDASFTVFFQVNEVTQTYWVWIEVYQHHFYAVKFHLKAHRHSDFKNNLMTGFNEARPCIRTCMAVMQEVAKSDPKASFGFIGANRIDEPEANTKRFRVYRRFMMTNFGREEYEHYDNWEKSAYILINRKELAEHPGLLDEIVKGFSELYPYFE